MDGSDGHTATAMSRRGVLTAAGTIAAGAAGCIGEPDPDPRYRLRASVVPEGLTERFRWEPRGRFPEQDRALMDELVEDGELVTEGYALYPTGNERPRYVEREDGYERIELEETGTVERDRWILWCDLIDGEPPADATVYDSPLGAGGGEDLAAAYGLDERDVAVVEDAAGAIPTEFGYRDLEDAPPGRRGHVFLRRDASETALLPEPPFDHVRYGEGDDARYARIVAERATVDLARYRHTAERVATSEDGYRAHLEERHLAADLTRDELAEDERAVLDAVAPEAPTDADASGGRTVERGRGEYEEAPPVSEGFASVLDRATIERPEIPEPGRVSFAEEELVRYDGRLLELQLEARG